MNRTIIILILILSGVVTSSWSQNTIDSLSKTLSVSNKISEERAKRIIKQNIWEESRSKSINMLVSIPFLNFYCLKPIPGKYALRAGFPGLGIGSEFFLDKYHSLILKWNGTITLSAPVAYDYEYGEEVWIYGMDINLLFNWYKERYSYGIGISLSRNVWDYRFHYREDPPSSFPYGEAYIFKKYHTVGIPLYIYFHAIKTFSVGINYRPSLFRLNKSPTWRYEHLFSLDFQWRIRIF